MIFIRIDDYEKSNHEIIVKIIKKSVLIIPNIKIIIGVIISSSKVNLLNLLLQEFSENVTLAFHGYIHNRTEFLQSLIIQEKSFIEAENFLNKLNYKDRFFIPPFNVFNLITIYLLKKYNYNNFSINYKDYQKNKLLLESNFKIFETNYFFNKKLPDLTWYVDEKDKIESEINNLKLLKINIGIEIHPQYITLEEDQDKYTYLLNCLKGIN